MLHHQQCRALAAEGIYLATRPDEYGEASLYHFPTGFFVEAFFHAGAGMVTRFDTFTSAAGLAPYAVPIELPPSLHLLT